MKLRPTLAAMLLVLAPAASADATKVVLPNVHATTEGALDNAFPYRFITGAGHYQQCYDAAQFPGPMAIGEIAYRYHQDQPTGKASAEFKMTLSYCATGWNALVPTFATNVGPGAKVVFDGVWKIGSFGGDPATPNPFTQRLKLTTPFVYDPSQGDLLMDIEMRSSAFPLSPGAGAFAATGTAPGVGRVFVDDGNPISPTGIVVPTGLITEFTSLGVDSYGLGCAGGQPLAPQLAWTGAPAPGAQVSVALSNGLGGAPSVTLIGVNETSLPVGGACTLLVAPPHLPLFIPLGGSGPGAGSYTLPGFVPVGAPPGTIRLQAFVADPSGPVGVSASNGLAITIGV